MSKITKEDKERAKLERLRLKEQIARSKKEDEEREKIEKQRFKEQLLKSKKEDKEREKFEKLRAKGKLDEHSSKRTFGKKVSNFFSSLFTWLFIVFLALFVMCMIAWIILIVYLAVTNQFEAAWVAKTMIILGICTGVSLLCYCFGIAAS